MLDVGNALSHYFACNHGIIDLGEVEQGVCKCRHHGVRRPARGYDLIVSISTIEHVGWDDRPRKPRGTERAIQKLFGLLAARGKMLVTVPLGTTRNSMSRSTVTSRRSQIRFA